MGANIIILSIPATINITNVAALPQSLACFIISLYSSVIASHALSIPVFNNSTARITPKIDIINIHSSPLTWNKNPKIISIIAESKYKIILH